MSEVQQEKRVSLVAKMADKFGVDQSKLMVTLKSTAFKVKDATATDEQMMALLIVADQYGLNPFTREIYAFPDNGGIVPVVGLDGWARIINENANFNGMDFTMTPEGDACTCTIYRKDREHSTSITEYLSECKRANVKPWISHPRRMLRHKAMIQCARLAFGFVGIYDQDEAERIIEGEAVREPAGKPRVETPKRLSATAAASVPEATETPEQKAEREAWLGEAQQ